MEPAMVRDMGPPTVESTTPYRVGSARASAPNPNLSALPPLNTAQSARAPTPQKPPSNKRLSVVSAASLFSSRSRPQSTVYPVFQSSLTYTLVRDFAYPVDILLHYGPTLDTISNVSTPASELRRSLSDPYQSESVRRSRRSGPPGGVDTFSEEPFSVNAWQEWNSTYPQLPATSYGDGPPWSEDEDLHSPVVTSTKHRKVKSQTLNLSFDHPRTAQPASGGWRTSCVENTKVGNNLSHASEAANGHGGSLDVYPLNHHEDHMWQRQLRTDTSSHHQDHLDTGAYLQYDQDATEHDESRYSRDYQFTIASPDEEMHGKAVALFDFARENENELPLVEGQVLWVSYRHGQGWLVAQDPKSGETGLVPEEYVRLVREIEGGLTGLNGQYSPATTDMDTPTSAHERSWSENSGTSGVSGMSGYSVTSGNSGTSGTSGTSQHYVPVVSHFSTSSKDLQPYPQHLLDSQQNTPTLATGGRFPRRGSEDPRILHDPLAEEDEEEDEVEDVAVAAAPHMPHETGGVTLR